MPSEEVLNTLPHREPFLFIDEIVELFCKKIICSRKITGDEDFFKGHYPGNPIVPGVILCETIFQAGAILIARGMEGNFIGTPVVTRVNDIKFKRIVKPGDELMVEAEITEEMSGVYFLKGKIKRDGKVCVQLTFGCTMVQGEK